MKYDREWVRIDYQKKRADGRGFDEYSMRSVDTPAADFIVALDALAADVVTICEFPPDDAPKLLVRGVSCTYADDVFGVVITALKALKTSTAPLVINTPHLTESAQSANNPAPVLPALTMERLRELLTAAERYVNGERDKQGALFTETPAAPSVEAHA